MYYCMMTILLICQPSLLNTYASDKSLARHISELCELHELSWDACMNRLTTIAQAPKLQYRLDKIEVYRDGVWVDYSVTNINSRRLFVAPMHLEAGVDHAEMWDADRHNWQVPRFDGMICFGPPDTFIAVPTRSTVRFRSRISPVVKKPLEPVGVFIAKKPDRPKELNYRIMRWSTVYSTVSVQGQTRESAYSVGFGKAPVRWHDEDSPKTLVSGTRLYGDVE